MGGFVIGGITAIATVATGGLAAGLIGTIGILLKAGVSYVIGNVVVTYISKQMLPQDLYLPLYAISPAEIFANKIALLDVNFFNPNSYDAIQTVTGTGNEQTSAAKELQKTIASWYTAIRNFAIVVLLSMLVYVGIKIIISSSAQDRAKYKQRLLDWLISICLLFFLHYIMTFAVTLTELITSSLNGMNKPVTVMISDKALEDYHWDFTQTQENENGETETVDIDTGVFEQGTSMYDELKKQHIIQDGSINDDGSTSNDGETLVWPTNLMGKARIEAQLLVNGEDAEGDNTLMRQFGYTVIFLGLVIYTVLFLFRYLKRLLMLAFLTIIAPLVAMTYALDKMNDGSAQAFNMWLKEYMYNLLIQPVHLILYTVLIGSAIDFASSNLLYALAALGFILEAEKIMRKFFGFEKASTLAGGSALGGALVMQGINMLGKIGPKQKKGSKGGSGGDGGGNDKVRFADRKADKGKSVDDLLQATHSNNKGTLPAASATVNSEEGTDTRGFGQWLRDEKWNGSKAQSGLNAAKLGAVSLGNRVAAEPKKFGRKIGNGVTSIRTKADNLARARLGGAYEPLKNTAKRTIRRAKGAGAVALKGVGAGIRYATPRAAQLAVKGTVAGSAALAGMAAGLASDDFGNVFKYGAAGAGAGWIGAGGLLSSAQTQTNNAAQLADKGAEEAASTYTIAAHGEEANEERIKRKADNAAMRDTARRKLYQSELGLKSKEEAMEAMKDAQKFREAGMTDDQIIIRAMKSKVFDSERASNERIVAAKLASEVGKDQKQLEYVKEQLGKKGIKTVDIEKYEKGIKEINKWTV